jgi:hypothetical protein
MNRCKTPEIDKHHIKTNTLFSKADKYVLYLQVWEETGFDVSDLLKVEDNLEVTIGEQRIRLFIIVGVKEDTSFAPRTKNEISVCSC